jgi:hypothetical protein
MSVSFAMAIILPLVSYNPTSLILGLSNNPKDGLVEVPNSPLPAIHVIF